jgi:acetylornithine deacetylase/succinyl-diaminopimelate desuccinylase-like protein
MPDSRMLAVQYARANQVRFLNDLKTFASIPSISTDPQAITDMLWAAQWLADHLKNLGAKSTQIYPTAGHPIVVGEIKSRSKNVPTVLIYGHYDVQPAEPLDLWVSPAFEPTIRNEYIYGRGVTDMKGQILATTHAIEAITRTGSLPVNIKFMIEGEEEIGSPSMRSFMEEHHDLLSCDVALNPDTGVLAPEYPAITYALRGLAYFELRVYGPDHDLHSGTFGGVVHNPAQALCELIAGMHDDLGKITLPGFLDRVITLGNDEKKELARLPLTEESYLEQTGAPALWGDPDYTPAERTGARPTLEIHGLLSGFTGEGSKTVLPSWAMAKLSCRLVPNQDPEEIHQSLRRYLEAHAPETIRWELKYFGGGPANLSNRHSVGVQALAKAMETTWGTRPLFKREGGSVPVVGLFSSILGVDSVNTGFATPNDNMHSPNEKLHLPTWYKGTEALVHFFFNLAES